MSPTAIAETPPSSPAAERQEEYRTIPIREIRESKTNPRRHFNEQAMADLVESIKQLGVLEPLLVRPIDQEKPSGPRFELVSGARRYRAAKAAGNPDVPCRILHKTDEQVLEIQVVENLQRDDLHAIEEARGYQSLMAPPYRRTARQIADKIGKSENYVYDRMKILQLIPELQEIFWNDEIYTEHAIRLARIPADKQKLCLETALFVPEHSLYDPEDQDDHHERYRKAISVRELQAWIDEHVRFETKPDPMLYPETAKTLEHAAQQDEKVLPITYDYVVQDTVRDGSRIFGPRSWVRADGQYGSQECEHSEIGLVVAGPRRGEAFRVCRDKHNCQVHYAKEIRERKRREKAAAAGGATARSKAAEEASRRAERERQEQARQEAVRQHWKRATPAILDALAAKIKTAPTKASGFLAQTIVKEIQGRSWTRSTDARVPVGTTADDVVRHAAYLILKARASNEYWAPQQFPKIVKALGIDLGKILKAAEPTPQTSAEQGLKDVMAELHGCKGKAKAKGKKA